MYLFDVLLSVGLVSSVTPHPEQAALFCSDGGDTLWICEDLSYNCCVRPALICTQYEKLSAY